MIKVWVKLKYALILCNQIYVYCWLLVFYAQTYNSDKHAFTIQHLISNYPKRLGYTMFQIKERQLGRMKNSYLTKIFFFDYRVVGSISLLNGYLFSKFMWK